MTSLLALSGRRYLARHPWLVVLSVLGVALGVAVVVAVDLANGSARRAFRLSAETVSGKATHGLVGGAEGLDESLYVRLRTLPGSPPLAPVVEGFVQSATDPGRTLQVLGVDPFAEGPFRPYLSMGPGESTALGTFLTQPGAAYLSASTARALDRGPGELVEVSVEGRARQLRIAGLLTPRDAQSRRALENLVVVDLSTAQELLDSKGRLSRVDLLLPDGDAREGELARLRSLIPPGAQIEPASSRTETLEQLTRAFSLNLTALSLLALVVGMFLIYNAMTFSVVQRREAIGTLRALGVTRGEVLGFVLREVMAVALLGTALGLAGGVALGHGLVRLVTQTVNDLYFVVTVRELTVTWDSILKAAAIGLGATGLAALFPALEATRAPPSIVLRRSTAETAFRANLVRTTAVGLGLSALGLGLLALPGKNLLLSYAGLFAILAGSAGVTPALTVLSAAGLRPLAGALFGPLGRMAARGVITHLSRNAVAIAALSTAVATTVSVALMVSSFRETVIQWLDVSLQADVFVSSPSLVSRGSSATLDPSVQERLRALPGTRGLSTIRRVRLNTSSGPSEVNVVQRAFPGASPYRFKEGDAEAVWRALETGDAVMVSEPFAFHRQVKVGDVLRLSTDRGDRPFRVAGIFYDFASDAGVVTVDRSAYERSFQDRRISGVALYASESEDADALVDRVRRALGDAGPVSIRSNRGLKQASLEVFDRTFTVTSVLRLLSVAVAFVGVLSALMALSLERARELAVLRALGLLPRQLWSLVTLQTGLLGLIAGLLSLPLGLAMASVLVHVINKRSFGWSLELSVTPGALAQAVGLAVGAALLAGLYPAWKMRRTPAALALREE